MRLTYIELIELNIYYLYITLGNSNVEIVILILKDNILVKQWYVTKVDIK